MASDPEKRLQQMKTGNSTIRMLLNFYTEYPAAVEIELHTKFEDRRVDGEWFDLSPQDLYYIYNKTGDDKYNLDDFVSLHSSIHNQKNASVRGWLNRFDRKYKEFNYE